MGACHGKYVKESLKKYFGSDAGEYEALEQENASAIAESVREGMESVGIDESEAYATAYWMRSEYVKSSSRSRVGLAPENPRGVQGYYRSCHRERRGRRVHDHNGISDDSKRSSFRRQCKDCHHWFHRPKDDPKKADLMSIGKLDGQTMTAGFPEDEEILLNIVFKGETASVTPLRTRRRSISSMITVCGFRR